MKVSNSPPRAGRHCDRTRPQLRLLPWLFVFCLFSCPVLAQFPPGTPIVFAGDLNGDGHADTVTGRNMGGAVTLLPDMIFWGWDHSQPHPPPGFIPTTKFVYPTYPSLAGSAAFLHLNPAQDTVPDMVFFLWGRNNSAATEPDTGRTVAIFGQSALSALHAIDFNILQDSIQTTPYYAQDLYINRHLTEPAVRDLSDVDSYLLPDANMAHATPPKPIITQVGGTGPEDVTVRIYPNPSLYTATLEAELPAGVYTARIVGVSGRVHHEQQIELAERGTLWRTLDLSDLASGYYMMQLERDGVRIGAYPFIIQR